MKAAVFLRVLFRLTLKPLITLVYWILIGAGYVLALPVLSIISCDKGPRVTCHCLTHSISGTCNCHSSGFVGCCTLGTISLALGFYPLGIWGFLLCGWYWLTPLVYYVGGAAIDKVHEVINEERNK